MWMGPPGVLVSLSTQHSPLLSLSLFSISHSAAHSVARLRVCAGGGARSPGRKPDSWPWVTLGTDEACGVGRSGGGECAGGAGSARARPAVPALAARWSTRLCTQPATSPGLRAALGTLPGEGPSGASGVPGGGRTRGAPAPCPAGGAQQETYARPEALTCWGHFLEQKTPLSVHFQTVRTTVGGWRPPTSHTSSPSASPRRRGPESCSECALCHFAVV